MGFDYFYGQQSQQFAFYRIPRVLFTDNRFRKISTDGKVLYAKEQWDEKITDSINYFLILRAIVEELNEEN